MPYDIYLVAQDCRYNSSYLPLIERIQQYFPHFKSQHFNIEHWKDIFDSYTEQEIIKRGFGIHLEAEFFDGIPKPKEIIKDTSGFFIEIRHEDWIEISFWDNGIINLAVPNYPHREISVAMKDILSVVRFLEQEGFAVENPIEDKIISKSEVEAFLYQSYLNRQIQVDRVCKIVLDE